jgi:hypothetical protein
MGCRNATILSASPDAVWSAISNFHDLSWSANVIESVEVVGEASGSEAGAKRVLNGAFHETLHHVDDGRRHFRYSVDHGPGPLDRDKVSGYVGEVSVLPVTPAGDADQTVVVWTAEWESEEGGVHDFVDPIYKALLGDLKAHFG